MSFRYLSPEQQSQQLRAIADMQATEKERSNQDSLSSKISTVANSLTYLLELADHLESTPNEHQIAIERVQQRHRENRKGRFIEGQVVEVLGGYVLASYTPQVPVNGGWGYFTENPGAPRWKNGEQTFIAIDEKRRLHKGKGIIHRGDIPIFITYFSSRKFKPLDIVDIMRKFSGSDAEKKRAYDAIFAEHSDLYRYFLSNTAKVKVSTAHLF